MSQASNASTRSRRSYRTVSRSSEVDDTLFGAPQRTPSHRSDRTSSHKSDRTSSHKSDRTTARQTPSQQSDRGQSRSSNLSDFFTGVREQEGVDWSPLPG